MFSDEIHNILSNDPITKDRFLGVYSADELVRITKKKNFCVVVNTDTQFQTGRHWQSIFVDNDRNCYFFCSLGEKPNEHIANYLKTFPKVFYNTYKNQRSNEITCGGFVIFILAMMCRGYPFQTLCGLLDNLTNDDNFIRSYLWDNYKYQLPPSRN
mgnify:CR=1 FL=1